MGNSAFPKPEEPPKVYPYRRTRHQGPATAVEIHTPTDEEREYLDDLVAEHLPIKQQRAKNRHKLIVQYQPFRRDFETDEEYNEALDRYMSEYLYPKFIRAFQQRIEGAYTWMYKGRTKMKTFSLFEAADIYEAYSNSQVSKGEPEPAIDELPDVITHAMTNALLDEEGDIKREAQRALMPIRMSQYYYEFQTWLYDMMVYTWFKRPTTIVEDWRIGLKAAQDNLAAIENVDGGYYSATYAMNSYRQFAYLNKLRAYFSLLKKMGDDNLTNVLYPENFTWFGPTPILQRTLDDLQNRRDLKIYQIDSYLQGIQDTKYLYTGDKKPGPKPVTSVTDLKESLDLNSSSAYTSNNFMDVLAGVTMYDPESVRMDRRRQFKERSKSQ